MTPALALFAFRLISKLRVSEGSHTAHRLAGHLHTQIEFTKNIL
jgi:hypothetical protein